MNQEPYTRFITIDEETLLLAEWAKLSGVSQNLILERIRRGWDEERAVWQPARKYKRPEQAEHGSQGDDDL